MTAIDTALEGKQKGMLYLKETYRALIPGPLWDSFIHPANELTGNTLESWDKSFSDFPPGAPLWDDLIYKLQQDSL